MQYVAVEYDWLVVRGRTTAGWRGRHLSRSCVISAFQTYSSVNVRFHSLSPIKSFYISTLVYVRTLTRTVTRSDTRAVHMNMCQSSVRLSVLRKSYVRTPSQELTFFPIGLCLLI